MGGRVGQLLPLVALAGVGIATGGFGLAPAAPAVGATAAAAGVAPTIGGLTNVVTAPTLFGKVASAFSGLSTFDKLALGLKGAQTAGQIAAGSQAADATEAAIALQENEAAFVRAERRRVLAAQTVQAASAGVAASPQLADAAASAAGRTADSLALRGEILDTQAGVAADTFAMRRRHAARRGSGAVIGSLLDFGTLNAAVLERSARLS